ncbi:rhodanese-like domain-containing protein [Hymenobacter metallilatus]|uniref:Rhodanese-like domain-containing protein n=1 Tax=Hymenobacter metallilatus TaxID=2493666 RepID=A0A428JMY1_9BACT|nr:rhodanese-like domain-containing protein [Hymenobacter metallilatus]RSK34558.1 rhodanese-like domain-containing protein [Hymenobacter metallilatus]
MTVASRPYFGALLGLLLLVACTACGQQRASTPSSPDMTAYDHMLKLLYKQTVPVVRPANLAALLQQPSAGVLLLDTRTAAEYRVSHLRGARFVDFDRYRQTDLSALSKTQPIVVYCTVGARSEQVGAWLREQGFQQVHNLYGGIFQWLNEGYGVVNAQGATTNVHPYSALWRPWLKKGTPVYE